MKSRKTIALYILVIAGVIVLINILSSSFFFRLDFTDDNRYTLSNATLNILEDLDEPVTVTAYFSEGLKPEIAKTKTDFEDLLIEYSNLSGGMVHYEFIDPNEDDEAAQKANEQGIQSVIINSREKDEMVQKMAYMGAVIQMGEHKDIIPFLQPGAAMEYALSSSIKKLSVVDKPLVGLLQGHGEPSMSSYAQMLASLTVMYDVEEVTLNDSMEVLDKYSTLVVVAPTDSFPFNHIQQLENYLAKGNNILFACNRVDGDLRTAMGSTVNTGLESWLQSKGLQIQPNFVVDATCANVNVPQRFGNMTVNAQVSFPYIPVVSSFPDHPITNGLEAVILQFASSMDFNGDTAIQYTPLLKSSAKSGTLSSPLYFDVRKRWVEQDFPLKELTLGALLEGKLAGDRFSRLIVFADGNFPVNGEGREMMQLQPDNINLIVNAIDYLSDDTGLIQLRTKGVTSRPIDQTEDGTKLLLKMANFLLPILLIILYGIFRVIRNRNLRIKRMEDNYV